jgi:hypothetical protein
MDMFVVPTILFRLLYGLLIVGHGRRHILWFGVTAHPNGSQIRSRKHMAGDRLPAISFVIGRGLWRDLHPQTSIHGHSRPADIGAFPMAKRIC